MAAAALSQDQNPQAALRILVAGAHASLVGGAESYLQAVIPALSARGHTLGLLHENPVAQAHEAVLSPSEGDMWCVAELGPEAALAAARGWQPDVLFVHGLERPELEERLLNLAPAICAIHGYYGTCISGAKTFTLPTLRPCARRFGWQCLALYYPRRTGGLNPRSMWREYRRQSQRLALLDRYRRIITLSEHMRVEYLNHGFADHRVVTVPPGIDRELAARARSAPTGDQPWRLIYLGRMSRIKGGPALIEALPTIARSLARSLSVAFVGEGAERESWERLANETARQTPQLTIEFTGWLERDRVRETLDRSHLLVVPSLWPEPFGLVGLEAGTRGVPTVAFDVGGISDWLTDGVNGRLAPGNPPTADGLAQAVIRALGDADKYQDLSSGALEVASLASFEAHVDAVESLLRNAAIPGEP